MLYIQGSGHQGLCDLAYLLPHWINKKLMAGLVTIGAPCDEIAKAVNESVLTFLVNAKRIDGVAGEVSAVPMTTGFVGRLNQANGAAPIAKAKENGTTAKARKSPRAASEVKEGCRGLRRRGPTRRFILCVCSTSERVCRVCCGQKTLATAPLVTEVKNVPGALPYRSARAAATIRPRAQLYFRYTPHRGRRRQLVPPGSGGEARTAAEPIGARHVEAAQRAVAPASKILHRLPPEPWRRIVRFERPLIAFWLLGLMRRVEDVVGRHPRRLVELEEVLRA